MLATSWRRSSAVMVSGSRVVIMARLRGAGVVPPSLVIYAVRRACAQFSHRVDGGYDRAKPGGTAMIFFRIGWMDRYEGPGSGDAITGGGAYVAQHGQLVTLLFLLGRGC
jgi:hypothetical protein